MKAFLAMCVVLLALGAAGCGPSPADITRMHDTGDDGPQRLAAIVSNAKWSFAVQKDAALALVTLTRRGRHVGLELLGDALAARPVASRHALIAAIKDPLLEGMKAARTEKEDPALAYKDGVYVIVARDLAAGSPAAGELRGALERWSRESGLERLDDDRQRYGPTSLLHALGPSAGQAVLPLLEEGALWHPMIDGIIADGDDATKHALSRSLAHIVDVMRTPAWRDMKRPLVEAANKAARVKATHEQVEGQLGKYRSKQIVQIFEGLGRLEYAESRAALLAAAESLELESADRVVALSTLTARAGALDDAQLDRLIALATAYPPREYVLDHDLVFGRPGAPWEDGIARAALDCAARAPGGHAKLLAFIASPPRPAWVQRATAGCALMRADGASAIEEVLVRLPKRNDAAMAKRELVEYAEAIRSIPGGKEIARKHLDDDSLGARLTAIATFADDPAELAMHEGDKAALYRCKEADECSWSCNDNLVTTVGQYVRECLESPRSKKP